MLDISRVRLVARRELTTRWRQRSFIITTIVQVLFVVAIGSLPVIVAAFSDDDPSGATVLIVDNAGANVAERMESSIGATDGDVSDEVTFVSGTESLDDARSQVDNGTVDAALVTDRSDDGGLAFTYVNDDGESDTLAQQMYATAAAISMEDRLVNAGIDQAEVAEATAPPAFALDAATDNTGETTADDLDGLDIALAYFFTIVMFMAIMLYGTWIAQGVVEEKSSRIMEIMINAATPRDLLAGKVIGIGAAGLSQLLPMLLAGGLVFGLQRPIANVFGINTDSLPDFDFGQVSVQAVGWFLVYFLLGFTLYAAMYAGLGSLVSRQEEVNQAVSPMMTVMMIGYLSAFLLMFMPDSIWSRVLSIFPLTSPFVMISRVIVGDPPAWEMALSVGLLAVTAVAAILVAARLYRIGVLQYGQKPGWKALFGSELSGTAR